jgi:predicted DNA-binding transcriptional regulator AlpA
MRVQEVAALLGVSRQRADQLSREKGFPEPVQRFRDGRGEQKIWESSAIEAWVRARDERSGRA